MPKPIQFPVSTEAFNEIYKSWFVKLCKYAYYLVNSKQGAEELVQDFFTALWRKQHHIRLNESLESYFFKSIKNAAYTYLKKQKRERENSEQLPETEGKNENIDSAYFLSKLEEAIQDLPDKTRIVYCLRYKEGLTYAETADYLNLSERTVETHLYRALKQLKKQLMPYKPAFYNSEAV